jgi:HEAT repeat protein
VTLPPALVVESPQATQEDRTPPMLHRGFRIDDHLPTALLVALMDNPEEPEEKRWAACLALGTKHDDASFARLREALDDPDWQIRRFALESLRRHAAVLNARADLIRMLFDRDDLVRQMACKVCGELGLREAHDGIVQLLEAGNPDVRDVALSTLAQLWEDADFEPVFRRYREDGQRAVRIAAAKVLRRRAGPATWRGLFTAWSRDREARHRLWACELAARFGGAAARPLIAPLALDKNPNVRAAARSALAAQD